MPSYYIKPSTIQGEIRIPSSKSHSIRALIFACLAQGTSRIYACLDSPDVAATLRACAQFGAQIQKQADHIAITGVAGKPQLPKEPIDVGNSGLALRFVAALACLVKGPVTITGDESIRKRRPMQPLITALQAHDVQCTSQQKPGFAPLTIDGRMQPGISHIDGRDSQPVSALLLACAFAKGPSTVHIDNIGERPWLDLTLDWFKRLGISYQSENDTIYMLGNSKIAAFDYHVPGDFSSLSYPLAAALLGDGCLHIRNVPMHDRQGDKALLTVLEKMGAGILYDENSLSVTGGEELSGQTIDVNPIIDALPLLAVIGCYAQGTTVLTNALIARHKESDRIAAMCQQLRAMGAQINELADGLQIKHSPLHGAKLNSQHDHRVAMALTVAAIGADGDSQIDDVACVNKTYPGFADAMRACGLCIEVR